MKRPVLIPLALVLMAAAGITLASYKGRQTPPSTMAPSHQPAVADGEVAAEVQLGEDSYQPAEVTISAGQAVRFKNTSRQTRWPASNIHPSHDLYPEFDPKRALEPGESWTFTFYRRGKWRMHDHLYPYMKGVVIVD